MSLDLELQLNRSQLNIEVSAKLSQVTVLLGASGAGKSSIVQAIAGLETATGFISFAGKVWLDSSKGIEVKPEKRLFAAAFQHSALFPHLTVAGNLNFALKHRNKLTGLDAHQSLLDVFNLNPLLNKKPASLSGGEVQRAALARALIVDQNLILLDEPLSAIDHSHRFEILHFLRHYFHQFKKTVVYVTHQLDEAIVLADQLWLIEQGKSLALAPIVDLSQQPENKLNGWLGGGAIVNVSLLDRDVGDGLSRWQCDQQILLIPKSPVVESQMRLHIPAKEVSISLDQPLQSSILNILPSTISTITRHPSGSVVLQLRLQQQHLLCNITQRSWRNLQLKVGDKVYAQIKSGGLILR